MGKFVTGNATGIVKTYKPEEGYGFVATLDIPENPDTLTDVFFHVSELRRNSVKEGWRLKFDIVATSKGYQAENIRIISKKSGSTADRKPRHGLNKEESVPDDTVRFPGRGAQGRKAEEDEEEDDDEKEDPFSDDIRGSKNDLL